ncbi:MAG TPA: hypothetical protein VK843_17010 [Planctomycetota bacterium]|nr:hypothetical protein [Planctomycetota bacterium]
MRDENEGTDVDAPPRSPYLGSPENPFLYLGIDNWRTVQGRFEPHKPVIVTFPINVVACCTPPPVDRSRAQRAFFVRFKLEPGTHVLPSDVADALCVVDPKTGIIQSGLAPLHTRPIDMPDAKPHPALLPPRAAREQARRGRARL